MKQFFGTEMPKLGCGLMRVPRLEDGKTIDVKQCEEMTDKFLAAGLKYFDTFIKLEKPCNLCIKRIYFI